jgi:hypothetical protein
MYRYLIIAVAAGITGGIIARSKGYNQLVWSLMCTVIPLLVVVILFMPARVLEGKIKKCPECGTVSREGETLCSNCGKQI